MIGTNFPAKKEDSVKSLYWQKIERLLREAPNSSRFVLELATECWVVWKKVEVSLKLAHLT